MVGGLHVVRRAPDASPAGPPVVVVHGAMDRAASFGRLAKRLADVEVLTYDRRGYAGSFAVGPSTRFDDQVDDLRAVLGLVEGPAVVVGHSFGGVVALALAAASPSMVLAAVSFEAPAPWAPWWPQARTGEARPDEVAERFMRRMVGDRIWQALPQSTRTQRRAEGATMVAETIGLAARRPYDPSAVTCPVVVGWGAESPSHFVRASTELAAELPHAVGVEVAGSSHGVHLTHPLELAALVRQAIAAARA